MTDPRASTALRQFPLDDPRPSRWSWAIVTPDPTGRVQLPPAALEVLSLGPVHARMVEGVLVLDHRVGRGRTLGIDRRGRCYLPPWLRRPTVLVATDLTAPVVLVADAAVLDGVGGQLVRAARA